MKNVVFTSKFAKNMKSISGSKSWSNSNNSMSSIFEDNIECKYALFIHLDRFIEEQVVKRLFKDDNLSALNYSAFLFDLYYKNQHYGFLKSILNQIINADYLDDGRKTRARNIAKYLSELMMYYLEKVEKCNFHKTTDDIERYSRIIDLIDVENDCYNVLIILKILGLIYCK
jgi:hypothetical protein